MDKVSAQQIRSLEVRIARLEKEAGFQEFMESVSSTFKSIVNIPKNMVIRIINAFKEIFTTVELSLEDEEKTIENALGFLLGSRIFRAMAGVITTTDDLPTIVKFNRKQPLKSTFTGGLAGKAKVQLKNLIKRYNETNQTRMKSAYLSWYSDFKHILNPKIKEVEGVEFALREIKKVSKLAYRFLSSIISVLGGVVAIKGTVISTLLFILGRIFLQKYGFPVGRPSEWTQNEVVFSKVTVEPVNATIHRNVIDVTRDRYSDYKKLSPIQKQIFVEKIHAKVEQHPMKNWQPDSAANLQDVKDWIRWKPIQFTTAILTPILALIETIMYKWVIKTDEYDEMVKELESRNKKASQYPTLSYLTQILEGR